MIYFLLVLLALVLLLCLHIMDCHLEIKQLKECVMIACNSLDKERERIKDLESGYLVNPALTENHYPFTGPDWDEYVKQNGDGFKKFDMDKLLKDSEK